MADLFNLLGELDENNENDDDNEYDDNNNDDNNNNSIDNGDGDDDDDDDDNSAASKQGRPSLAATEATEPMMSEEWDSPIRGAEVPAALQEALEKNNLLLDRDNNDDDDDNDNDGYKNGNDDDAASDVRNLEEIQHVENELYSRLQHYWHQERHCPELLAYDDVMFNDVKEQITERQEYIDQLMENNNGGEGSSSSSNNNNSVQILMATMAQLDLDRIKFVFSDWLSTRLAKIEAHPLHMRDSIDKMSDAEIAYLKEYGAMLEHHLRTTVLDHIPEAWQTLDDENMIETPDYEAYHFWLVKEPMDIRDFMEQQDEGTCLVARYKDMAEPFREGKVELQL